MTDFPNKNSLSDNHKEENLNQYTLNNNQGRSPFKLNLRLLMYVLVLSMAGSLSYGWYFLTQKLVPLIETPVSNYLGREIQLGKVESISFTSIRIGKSQIPSNEIDNDYVTAEGVEISINPLLLLQQQVDLTIKLIRPFGYLQQDEDNAWLRLNLATGERQPFYGFTFDVNNIKLDQGLLTLKGDNTTGENPLKAKINNGKITFNQNNNLYEVQGEIISGGDFQVTASQKTLKNEWLVDVRGNQLLSDDINYFLSLPFNADSGFVTGNIKLNFDDGQVTNLNGDIDINAVNFDIPNVPQLLTNSNGNISFEQKKIYLNKVNTNLGLINGDVQGYIDIDNHINLQVITQSVEVQDAIASLNLPPIPLQTKGKIIGKVDIQGRLNQPEIITTVNNLGDTLVDNIIFQESQVNFTIVDSQLTIDDFFLIPNFGGEITGKGFINLNNNQSEYVIDWEAKQISAQKLANLYQQEISSDIPPIGFIEGEYQLSGLWNKFNESQLTGIAQIDIGEGKATLTNINYTLEKYRAEIQLSGIPLNQIALIDCQTFGCENSTLQGKFQLFGDSKNINLETINIIGDFNFPLADNTINLKNTQLTQGKWQTQLIGENLDIEKLSFLDTSSLPIKQGKVNTQLEISGNVANVDSRKIVGKGNITLPQGLITVNNFSLDNQNNFMTNLTTNKFNINDFQADLRGNTTGNINIRGNINNLSLQTVFIDGDLRFNQGINLIQQPIQTSFRWDGQKILLTQATTKDISANGIINYNLETQTIENFDLNLSASRFDIQNLPLPSELDIINYQGKVNFQGKLIGDLNNQKIIGNVNVDDLVIANLAFNPLAGKIEGDTTTGIALNLQDVIDKNDKFNLELSSNYQLKNIDLQVNQGKIIGIKDDFDTLNINITDIPLNLVTESLLTSVPLENDYINFIGGNLSGVVALNLETYDFVSPQLTIKNPRINQLQGDILTAKVSLSQGKILVEDGELNHLQNEYIFQGEIQPFEKNPRLEGNLSVTNGNIQDMLTSFGIYDVEDIFSGGIHTESDGKARDLYIESSYDETQPNKIHFSSVALTQSSNIDDEVKRKREDDLSRDLSYGDNEDKRERQKVMASVNSNLEKEIIPEENKETFKPLIAISNDNLNLEESILQWEKVNQKASQTQRERQQANLPLLEDLEGLFNGDINIKASVEEGVNLNFNFQGDNWNWGKYKGDTIIARGSFNDGLLTILPIRIQDNESILSLSGTFRQERISGQVILTNLPLSDVAQMANVPSNLEVEGIVNANIVISGSQNNPLGRGSIDVVSAKINGNKIEEINANLGYRDSRFDFLASSNLTGDKESARLIGSLPFKFFPQSNNPEKDDFRFNLNIEESGFGLLKVITNNQFDLVDGSGGVDLSITGEYNQNSNQITNVTTQGIANLSDGQMMVEFIPDTPITDINGEILFDFDQISIPSLTGNFSDGDIIVTGSLPLFSDSSRGDSLNVSVDNLVFNLDNLYRGNGMGMIDIGGSAIAPIFSGNITLFDGEIPLADRSNNGNNDQDIDYSSLLNNPLINNAKVSQLELTLADNVTINQPPLLSLQGRGSLILNGTLNNLQPEGVINLTGGKVNLFTSQLRLSSDYNNTAKFTPENGFNAFLDMRLETKVTQTSRNQFVNNIGINEIRDDLNNTANIVETVRVTANVNGLADNIDNSLELTSSPPRNETEIISLLGGGFLSNFGDGDSGLALANIASAAFFGGIQNLLSDDFGGVEFRIFPTPLINTDTRVSTLGLGGELSFDFRDNFSFSVLSILTEEQQPLYSIRYRLNQQTILRGSTDFNNENRAVVEFQLRF